MNNDSVIISALEALRQFNSKSVFLYGSRGRSDSMPNSDYEIGVIFDDANYVQRHKIHAVIDSPNVKAYPFKLSELLNGTFDTPFQKTIYLHEIIKGGRTIDGEHLIEQIPPPPIAVIDLIQRIRFDIGYALAALLSYRNNDMQTSMEEFCKSCLLGVRNLEILELKIFPLGYDEIYELSKKVATEPRYTKVIDAAYSLRNGAKNVEIDVIFDNISLLNKLVEAKIIAAFEASGNVAVI